jgi:hypothetical protein
MGGWEQHDFKDRTMSTSAQIIDLFFVGLVVAMILFWIFVIPERARKQRRAELGTGNTSRHQAWDQDIGARRRER